MKRQGFTLVELLVVIAIIGILGAILFPVFASAKESAKQVMCMSNMRQIGLAARMYTADNDDYYFPVTRYEPRPGFASQQVWIGYDNNNGLGIGSYVGKADAPAKNPIRPGLIDPYLKSEGVKRCPSQGSDVQLALAFSSFHAKIMSSYYFKNKAAKDAEYGPGSKNYRLVKGIATFDGASNSEVEEDTNTLLAFEHLANVPVCNFLQQHDWVESPPDQEKLKEHFNFLHRGAANTVWVDGHAKRMSYPQLKRPMFSVRKDLYNY